MVGDHHHADGSYPLGVVIFVRSRSDWALGFSAVLFSDCSQCLPRKTTTAMAAQKCALSRLSVAICTDIRVPLSPTFTTIDQLEYHADSRYGFAAVLMCGVPQSLSRVVWSTADYACLSIQRTTDVRLVGCLATCCVFTRHHLWLQAVVAGGVDRSGDKYRL